MEKIIFPFLIFVCTSTITLAQSVYLDQEQDGVQINAKYLTNNNSSGITGGIGYSLSGLFDFGLSYSHFKNPQRLDIEDLYVTVISPHVSFLVIKERGYTSPISLSLNGAYRKNLYSNDFLRDIDIDLSSNYLTIGGQLTFTDLHISNTSSIQPKVGVNYIFDITKYQDSYSNSEPINYLGAEVNVGISFVSKTSMGDFIVITPELNIVEEELSFGISLSLVNVF